MHHRQLDESLTFNILKEKLYQRKQLLTLTVEISEGRQESIIVREGDSPSELARSFITKNGMDARIETILSNYIKDTIDSLS